MKEKESKLKVHPLSVIALSLNAVIVIELLIIISRL